MRVLLIGLLLLLSGCATFESGELPMLDRWPPQPSPGARLLAVQLEDLPEKFAAGWQRGVVKVLEDSGRFARVTTDGDVQYDRRLSLTFAHERQNLWVSRIWMTVCAFSATVIPARSGQCFGVRAVVFDRDGRQLGVIERQVEGATWVGILTLFALPFSGAGLGELIEDTMRSVTMEAVAKGWL